MHGFNYTILRFIINGMLRLCYNVMKYLLNLLDVSNFFYFCNDL